MTSLIGDQFGRLTVIAEAPPNKHGQACITVRCFCGKEYTMTVNAWKQRKIRTCVDCLRQNRNKNRIGEKYRSMVVIDQLGEWVDDKRTVYLIRCEKCGEEKIVKGRQLGSSCRCEKCDTEEEIQTVIKTNKVGITGISIYGNRYKVQYTRNRQRHYVGVYKTLKEAAEALKKAKELDYNK